MGTKMIGKFIVFVLIVIVSLIISLQFYIAGYADGYRFADESNEPEKVISQSQIDVYNRYMLKNCLQELQTLRGGE